MARLLATMGRLNVAPRRYSESARTTIAFEMVSDAVDHVLASDRIRTVPGYVAEEVPGSVVPIVRSFDRIAMNTAPASEIESLPGIGAALAQRTVNERNVRLFRNLHDLGSRVPGIGPTTTRRIAGAVTFVVPTGAVTIPITGDRDRDWMAIVERQSVSRRARASLPGT